jgi:hypothetical protein
MDAEETTKTATPKVATILAAAGKMFHLTDALTATGHLAQKGGKR